MIGLVITFFLTSAYCDTPPGVPTTVYGVAYDSDGDPMGSGKEVKVYINGELYQTVETFAGAESDSVYVLTFEDGDVDDDDELTFKIDGYWADGSVSFDDLEDLESLDLSIEEDGNDDDDDNDNNNGNSNNKKSSSGNSVSLGNTGGIQLPPPNQAQDNGDDGEELPPSDDEDAAETSKDNGISETKSPETASSPTGAVVAGDDTLMFLGIGIVACLFAIFAIYKRSNTKRRYSIQ